MPEVRCPEISGWRWDEITRSGDVADLIDQTAREIPVDLIVMFTEGRNGFLDALRGNPPVRSWPFPQTDSSDRSSRSKRRRLHPV